MTTKSKQALRDGINIYNATPSDKKQELVQSVKNNLKVHYNGLKTIGIGLDEDLVVAGKVFLRIFNK